MVKEDRPNLDGVMCQHSRTVSLRFNKLATKSEKWNGKPRLDCVDGRHPPKNTPVGVLSWTCRSEGKRPSRQTGGQSNPHKWLASRKICTEVLRSLRHHTIDHLEKRGFERGSTRRSSLELFQRQRWGNFRETWWSAYGLFQAHRYHIELN